jgi:hypothetical protein
MEGGQSRDKLVRRPTHGALPVFKGTAHNGLHHIIILQRHHISARLIYEHL